MQEGHLPPCCMMLTATSMFCKISWHGVRMTQLAFLQHMLSQQLQPLWGKATPVGFEPTRGDPIGLAGRHLNRSAKVSLRGHTVMCVAAANHYSLAKDKVPCRRATYRHVA